MKMKLVTLGMAAALAVGSIGIACATPDLIQNGDFSSVTGNSGPAEFGTLGGPTGGIWGSSGPCNYASIANWTGNGGYEIRYPNAGAASSVEPCSYYHSETQLLSPITAPPSAAGSGSFVGMDGITSPVPHASISQTIGGLTAGTNYAVSFWWGNTQLQNRSGPTSEYLNVSLGGSSLNTATSNIGTHGWSGWSQVTMTFMAHSSSEVLNFMSVGTPNSLPPFAVLTGVSMHAVPEPSELGMFGIGLLGLGFLTVVGYRRKQRLGSADSDGDNT